MKVKKFFHASRRLIGTMRLYSLPSPVHIPTAHKWIHTALHTMCPLPSIFLDPPPHVVLKLCSCGMQFDHTLFSGKSHNMLALCNDLKAANYAQLCWHNISKPINLPANPMGAPCSIIESVNQTDKKQSREYWLALFTVLS